MHLSVIKGKYADMSERGLALLSLAQVGSRCAHLCVMRESRNACASGRDGKVKERKKEGILVLCVFKVFSLDTNADEAR